MKLSGPDLKYCPGIFLEGLRKITKKRSVDNRSPAICLNPEFQSEAECMLICKDPMS
jgi:hypothetical protein